jgi:monoamine oxidase
MDLMTRKKFLKLGVLGLPYLLNCSSRSSSNNKLNALLLNSIKKIIILGAGIAGISCARALRERGFLNVKILEGRRRAGGRIHSLTHKDSVLDLGAAWIHGYKNNPITSIANKLNLRLYQTDDNNVMAVQEGVAGALPEDLVDGYESIYENIVSQASEFSDPNESLKEVIQYIKPDFFSNPIYSSFFSANEEFDVGGDASEMSSEFYDADASFEGADVVFPNGFSAIIDYLKQGLDIRYDEIVNAVTRVGSEFRVTTNSNSYSADIVICALPLGVIKSGKIKFTPNLSLRKRESIERIGVGAVNKVVLEYPTAFWDTSKQYINYFSNTKGKFSYLINLKTYTSLNMICGITTGNYSATMDAKSDLENKNTFHSILKSIYGAGIPNPINSFVTHWKTDPFSLGAYSFQKVGSYPEDYDELAKTEHPNLLFCGEHTNRDYRGTVHGAYLSGIRVADEILQYKL